MRNSRFPILVLSAIAFVSSDARAGSLRLSLLADAEAQGDTILLANLLPGNAPQALREAARAIRLGTAPQNGSARCFSRDAILTVLHDNQLSASSFSIPEIVTVRRAGRSLSREEVFAAIHTALAKKQAAEAPKFTPDDLALEAAVEVPNGDARLKVTQISFDQSTGRVRFRLRPQAAPNVLPFYVTVHLAPADSAMACPPAAKAAAFGATRSSAIEAPVLVDPHESAYLHLRSQNSEMLLSVKPLQRGHLGEKIRVRLPVSGKTLRASVVGSNSLEAVF